jgi:hypothetical protein
MKSNSNMDKKLKTTPIAIIGISAIFPGATNKQDYWDNILNKIDTVTDVPATRWNIDDYYDPDPKAEDKTYCKRGGFIPILISTLPSLVYLPTYWKLPMSRNCWVSWQLVIAWRMPVIAMNPDTPAKIRESFWEWWGLAANWSSP